jgi:hypothetical protein
MLLNAFRTSDYKDFPDLDKLLTYYPWYPKTYAKWLVEAAAEAIAENAPIIDRKSRDLNRAMAVLFWTVLIILSFREIEAVTHEQQAPAGKASTTRSTLGSPASASAGPAGHDYEKKR